MGECMAGNRDELNLLSQDELIDRIIDLESILEEFQDSSKQLEQALEMEIQALETDNCRLKQGYDKCKLELDGCKSKVRDLTQELNDLYDIHVKEIRQYNQQLHELKQQIVSVEISNDNIESNDRILSHKLELSNQFNNELLEKLASIESDLEREKKSNLSNQLYITNYQNQVHELTEKLNSQQKFPQVSLLDEDTLSANTTILELADALADCNLPHIPEFNNNNNNPTPKPIVSSYSKIQLKLPSQFDLKSPQSPTPSSQKKSHSPIKCRIPHSQSTRRLSIITRDDSENFNQKRKSTI
jgi:chromosome segregation ATPase